MSSMVPRLASALAFLSVLGNAASAADLVPYRAVYNLAIASTQPSSGVVGAGGVLLDEWNETCDGWTEQEHFYLHLDYGKEDSEPDTADTYTNFVTWEAKDALSYRFYMRRASTEGSYDEVRGEARLDGPDKGGIAEFSRPKPTTLPLAPGVMFPSAHTRFLIERAAAGDHLVTRKVFDGSDVENAGQVTAVIGRKLAPGADPEEEAPASPLLQRPSWRVSLAFFPADSDAETPDYQESLRLLDNGVTEDMLFDYGDYSVRATLGKIEALPRPHC
jgi:hypothetical protein